MGIINKYHKMFISSYPIHDFCREQKIVFSYYNLDDLVDNINELVATDQIDSRVLKSKLEEWIYQGRKKIVFRYLDSNVLREIRNYEVFKGLVESKLTKSDEIKDITELRATVDQKTHLVDIRYYFNDFDNENLQQVVFLYVKIVKYIKIDENGRTESDLPLPVYVTIDFVNNEIHSRINAKSNIYDFSGNNLNDIDIAINYMESLLTDLGLDKNMDSGDSDIIKNTIYETHQNITKIPEEVIQRVDVLDEDINKFILKGAKKLNVEVSIKSQEELNYSIKNLFIKEVIKTLNRNQKEELVSGNYGFSTAITASGRSFSKLRHSSPGMEALHLLPEYQNIRPILEETGAIDRDTIYWTSIRKPNSYVRSKLFINTKGYGIISFEEYVYEEDIKNVFSKIRESKPTRIV